VGSSSINAFRFEIGGCFSGTEFVELKGNGFIQGYSMRVYPNDGEQEIIVPSKKEWVEFETLLEHLNVMNWKKKYVDPYVQDGTQWSLKISKGGAELECYGFNDYPPEFDEFVAGVNKLAQSDLTES